MRPLVSFARHHALAVVAIVLSLGGTSYAVAGGVISGSQLSPGSVGRQQLAMDSVDTRKVVDGSLLRRDFAPGQLPRGARGRRGRPGARGPRGLGATVTKLAAGDAHCPSGGTQVGAAYACNGAAGVTGPQGLSGAQGEQGLQGDIGPSGPQGPAGTGFQVVDGNGATLGDYMGVSGGAILYFNAGVVRTIQPWTGNDLPSAAFVYYSSSSCTGPAYLSPTAPREVPIAAIGHVGVGQPEYEWTTPPTTTPFGSFINALGQCQSGASSTSLSPAVQVGTVPAAAAAPITISQ